MREILIKIVIRQPYYDIWKSKRYIEVLNNYIVVLVIQWAGS